MPGNIISLPCWCTPAEIERSRKTLAPQPFLSPLDTTFASPLPSPEEEPLAAEGPTEGGVLPTTSASSSPLPEPGDPVPGSETRYRPYGEVRTPGEPVAGLTAHTFTGQALDPDTGLMYYRARWYDPRLGRFVSADTVVPEPGNPQALNRYAYAGNNPVLYNDPSGHCGPFCGGLLLIGTIAVLTVGTRETLPPRPQTVARAAEAYGIPYPILAGVLDAERALDTNYLDYVETAVYDLAPLPVVKQIVNQVFPNPGPGPGNFHVETARSVSAYFAEYYSDSAEMQLNLHELSTWEITKRLADPEFNVIVAAAYVRQLADYRFGSGGEPLLSSHADLSQWTLEDAIAVWHGYRYGIHGVTPNWRGMLLQDFQDRGYDLDALVEVSMGVNKEESMYGAVPYFQLHVPEWR